MKSKLFIKELVPPPVSEQDIDWLKNRLMDDVKLIRGLTGKNFTTWKHF